MPRVNSQKKTAPYRQERIPESETCSHLLELAKWMREKKIEFWIEGIDARLWSACGPCQRNEVLEAYEAE